MSFILFVLFFSFFITRMDFFFKCTHCDLEFQDKNSFATHARVIQSHGINSGTTTNPCNPCLICRKCHRSYDKKKGFQGKGMSSCLFAMTYFRKWFWTRERQLALLYPLTMLVSAMFCLTASSLASSEEIPGCMIDWLYDPNWIILLGIELGSCGQNERATVP